MNFKFKERYQRFCEKILFFDNIGIEFTGKDFIGTLSIVCAIVSLVFLSKYVTLHWREGYYQYLFEKAWWLIM